jgi:hypothetical protein
MDGCRNGYAAGRGHRLQACSKVNAGTIEIAAKSDNIAQVHADPQLDLAPVRPIGGAGSHGLLQLNCTLNSLHHAGKFDEGAITHQLEGTPAELRNHGLENGASEILKSAQSPGLVVTHETAVTHHIDGHDRG